MSGARFFENDPDYRDALREPFPPESIGKLPRVWCKACSEAAKRGLTCEQHTKRKCGVCGNNMTEAHLHLDFVSHALVTDRLNHIAPDWSMDIQPVEAAGHVVAIVGTMTVGGKTLPEVGAVDGGNGYGDEYKRGISDFIRRAAMRFGVALDVWMKEDAEDFKDPAPSSTPPSVSMGAGTAQGGGAGQRSEGKGSASTPRNSAGAATSGVYDQPSAGLDSAPSEHRSAADTPGDPGSPGRGPSDPGPNPAGHHSETAPAPDGASASAGVNLPSAVSEQRSEGHERAETLRSPGVSGRGATDRGRDASVAGSPSEQTSAGADALVGGGGPLALAGEPLPPVEVTYDTAQQIERLREKFGGVLLKRAREVLGGVIFVEADLEKLSGEDLARLLNAPKKAGV